MPAKSPRPKPKAPTEKYTCHYCARQLAGSSFYMSTDPLIKTGYAPMCKECAKKFARRYDERSGEWLGESIETMKSTLQRLDKPWLKDVFERAYRESSGTVGGDHKDTIWDKYIQVISIGKYSSLRWNDSDFDDKDVRMPVKEKPASSKLTEAEEEKEKNRQDIVRLVGYDPFEKEPEEDKAVLYAQFIGYLDSEGNNDDPTRVLDSIEIVRGYSQLQKINDMSAAAFQNLTSTGKTNDIRTYMDTKKKLADVISQLAEQSCISLKHNKNAKKGENTWTGKIKKLHDINLREAEVNGFDIATCRGMQQVLELSDESILKQLKLDESEWSNIVADQRQMVTKLQREKDIYQEINRVLLRENIDLRDILSDNGLLREQDLKDLKQLFSAFGAASEEGDDNG